MAVVVRGRGDRALRVGHTDLEVGTRLFKEIVGEVLAAQGIRALVDRVAQVSCDTADFLDLLRHVDGCRIAQGRCHLAGEAEAGADPLADGADGIEDLADHLIIQGADISAESHGVSDDIRVLSAVNIGNSEHAALQRILLLRQDLIQGGADHAGHRDRIQRVLRIAAVAAFSDDLHLIDTDSGGIRPRSHSDGAERKGGSAVETVDEIHVIHDTFLAERLSAAWKLFLGCLEDQLHCAVNEFRMGCQDLCEG